MDRISTALLCAGVAFAAFGLAMMPGMPIGVTKLSAYIAGIAVGVWIGASLGQRGWIWIN